MKYGTAYHVLWVSCEDLEEMTKTDERPFPESDTKPRLGDFWHVNRPGKSGDSVPWEGWSHVREYVEEVPGRAA